MRSTIFTDITTLNLIGMDDYRLERVEDDNICFVGEQGYPNYFRVEVAFVGARYITSILHIELGYSWRLATLDEANTIIAAFSIPTDKINVYCVEEDEAGPFMPGQKNPFKFFIAAHRVEIVLHYDETNQHHLALLDSLEKASR